MIIADSNILIDIFDDDQDWADWSEEKIASLARDDSIVVNQIVVAEVAPRFGSVIAFQNMIADYGIMLLDFDAEAALEAGKANTNYRRNRGKAAPSLALPDFFIGGHALVCGATVLTRDPRFYRTYFPDIRLITPDNDHD